MNSEQPAQYVIDGGSHLHNPFWPANAMYDLRSLDVHVRWLSTNEQSQFFNNCFRRMWNCVNYQILCSDPQKIKRMPRHRCQSACLSGIFLSNNGYNDNTKVQADPDQKWRRYFDYKKTLPAAATMNIISIVKDSDLLLLLLGCPLMTMGTLSKLSSITTRHVSETWSKQTSTGFTLKVYWLDRTRRCHWDNGPLRK